MIKAALFGLGRIGASYDRPTNYNQPEQPRSHLGALLDNPAFDITALIDKNPDTFEPWASKFSKPIFFSVRTSWRGDADVIILATPPDEREKELNFILQKKPKVIIFEKPLASDLEQAKKISSLLKDCKTQTIVNFHRRYDPHYQNVREMIPSPPLKIVCRYSKGLHNYASHHIDLIQHWFGNISNINRISTPHKACPDFCAELESGAQVYFLGFDDILYDVFDMDVYFRDSVLRIENGGCEILLKSPVDNLYYEKYTHLDSGKKLRENGQVSGMRGLYKDIQSYITGKTDRLYGTSLEESIKNMQIIDMVINGNKF